MDDPVEIKNIRFGVFSEKDILEMSVCELNNSKLVGPNTVYDPRMGSIENNQDCFTCGLSSKNCPGHYGHIKMVEPVCHPLYNRYIINFLKCFCFKCYSLLISKEQLNIKTSRHLSGETRFKFILEQIEKLEYCYNCSTVQPKYMYSNTDMAINALYKVEGSKETQRIIMETRDIMSIFDNITEDDVTTIGLDPNMIQPKNLIIKSLPVMSPASRPYVITDNMMCDDDLTIQYLEIIKLNNHLSQEDLSETKRQKYISSLKFRVKCLMDNSHGKSKHTNNRPLKGVKERISGKSGIIRCNIMGKRVNQSARSVIGPDTTLRMGEIAVPEDIAETLTRNVRVCDFNKDNLLKLIEKGKCNFIVKKDGTRLNLKYALFSRGTPLELGDELRRKGMKIIQGKLEDVEKVIKIDYKNIEKYRVEKGDVLIRDGLPVDELRYYQKRNVNLDVGDTVERQLQDGDYVFVN